MILSFRRLAPPKEERSVSSVAMEITSLSGATLCQLHEEELGRMVASGKTFLDLKILLANQIGRSRFRQRLFTEMGELQDDMPLTGLPSVQLVILDFCTPEKAVWDRLLLACRENQDAEVANLLKTPLNPDGRCAHRDSPPIWHAAQQGHLEVVRLLLEAGADMNAANTDGTTALFVAAEWGYLEVVRLLIEAEADMNAKDAHGDTALLVAAMRGHLEVVRLLLKAGADMNVVDTDGATALFVAAAHGRLEVLQLLLEAGADVNAARADGATALFVATENSRNSEVVRLLLEAGADVNAAKADGTTALFVAASRGDLEKVQLLLEAGA